MSTIVVGPPRQYVDRGWPAIASRIQVGDEHMELYFRCSQGPLSLSSAPFVLSMLLPAMKLGASVCASSPLSAQLMTVQETLQRIILADFPSLRHALVGPPAGDSATPSPAAQPDERGVFIFFSGGVDSFYTLLEHQQEISHCVFVHGFDTLLANAGVRARNVQAMREATAELGKPLIEIETNYRSCVDRFAPWEHGSATIAQCAIACALSPQFGRGYVAQNYDYLGFLRRPGIEPNYRLGDMEVVQDGLDCLRLDKTIRIATSETAMRWLRVCWQNKRLAYNCGRCEKCLRTMIALHLAGALSRCRTFNQPIDLQRVRYLDFGNSMYFWPELLAELERRAADADLAEAVRDSIGWASTPLWLRGRLAASFEKKGNVPELERILKERMAYAQMPLDPHLQAIALGKTMTRVFDLEQELRTVRASRSWKLTKPVRALGRFARRLGTGPR